MYAEVTGAVDRLWGMDAFRLHAWQLPDEPRDIANLLVASGELCNA